MNLRIFVWFVANHLKASCRKERSRLIKNMIPFWPQRTNRWSVVIVTK